MQFHEKHFFDLFDFTRFFAWSFFYIFWSAVQIEDIFFKKEKKSEFQSRSNVHHLLVYPSTLEASRLQPS